MFPKVSVVVPIYKVEKYLSRCIESITNQSYTNLEIILVNDGSPDRCGDICEEYALQDSRIKVIHKVNGGVSTARNTGIDVCNGKYIAFIDADDTIEKTYVEKLVSTIENNRLDIVSCGYIDQSKYGNIKLNDFYNEDIRLEKKEFINRIFNGVGGTVWGKIFKRNIIIDNNIRMNSNIFMCEDMIFVLEYAIKCERYGVINENLYNYNRLNEDSISSKINLCYYNNLIKVIEEIEDILRKNEFEDEYIDNILSKRIKDTSIVFLLMQHDKKHNYSNTKKIENIKTILKNDYYKQYEGSLIGNSVKDKVILFLMKANKIKMINFYTKLLYSVQKIKDKIKGVA